MNTEKIRIIKKYQNRKLYDTKDSCYVTLDGIAKMIRNNEEISVIDNTTKNDVTALILTQVLYEQEKNNKSVLPISVLKFIIQSASNSLYEFMKRYLVANSDLATLAREEAERQVDQLIRVGELSPADAEDIIRELNTLVASRESVVGRTMDDRLAQLLERMGETEKYRTQIQNLTSRISDLETRLSAAERSSGRPAPSSHEAVV